MEEKGITTIAFIIAESTFLKYFHYFNIALQVEVIVSHLNCQSHTFTTLNSNIYLVSDMVNILAKFDEFSNRAKRI